jgi:hypothetical protein
MIGWLRIKSGGLYDGCVLQMYVVNSSNHFKVYLLGDNFRASGWTLKNFIVDASDPGDVDNYVSFTETTKVALNTSGDVSFSGDVYSGGRTTQYKNLTTNNFTSTSTDIKMNGTQSAGSLVTMPKADHVHPSDTTRPSILTDNITVTVGTGGNYATINEALAYLTTRYPIYKTGGGVAATISLLTGYVMAEQVLVSGIDLGWITITSVDATVSITRSALITSLEGVYCAFGVADGGMLPIIDVLFVMDTSGTGSNKVGVFAHGGGSRVRILNMKGVTAAGYVGFYARGGSIIDAYGANASGAGTYGIYATQGAKIAAYGANAQMGASPAVTDFVVAMAGVIIKNSGTGGVSKTANTITTDGIIFG